MNNTVRMQVKINATPQTIYTALTAAEALQTWLAEHAAVNLADGQFTIWGRFTPGNPQADSGHIRLLGYEPDRRLTLAWHVWEVDTVVEFKLLPRDAVTILTVIHENGGVGAHQMGDCSFEDFWFLSLENLRRYIDGKSAAARVDFSKPLRGNVQHSALIDAPPERVFAVLLKPAEVERWIASKATIEPKETGAYTLGWGFGGAVKILELQPNKKLACAWEGEPDTPATVLTWMLEGSGGKTRLTLVHSGFADDANTGGIIAGWRNFLNWIQSIAEYGDDWQPPLVPLNEKLRLYYPASIWQGQDELEFRQ